jgi:hypothetical protein
MFLHMGRPRHWGFSAKHSPLRFLAVIVIVSGCAQRHLPAGAELPMAEVLLRQRLHALRCPCYVFVADRDLPAERAAALTMTTGVTFLPGSAWSLGKQGLRVRIGLPRPRWNGNFDVAVTYDCGPRECLQTANSLMRYDGSRWRVVDD